MLAGKRPNGLSIVGDADPTSRSRCVNKPGSYLVLPRANRVEHRLPGFCGVDAQVLATPRIGARFVEHELMVHPNGGTSLPRDEDFEQFFFVLEGELDFAFDGGPLRRMVRGGFAWLPPHCAFAFANRSGERCRVLWLRRRYEVLAGVAIPAPIFANESDVVGEPCDSYWEKHLTPYESIGFDLGINFQIFEAGVYFPAVEAHVMEHGLYMVDGCGLYFLNNDLIEVQKDDFIYMAPYCPQFYYAMGWEKSSYLLYKDVNRDYTDGL
jgi:(S)-ureidoglycine aminohydrolase